jgi:hypothetical protein
MMHTAACHIRMPAYRHKTNTAMPMNSAAEILTVKAHHLLSRLVSVGLSGTGYPAPKLRRTLRRSHRTRNRHFSHTPATSVATAPHAHIGPLRHPFNSRPILITSRHRVLAFRKVRNAEKRRSPDTIGSGKRRVSHGLPHSFQWARGSPHLFACGCAVLRPGPCRIQSRTGRGFSALALAAAHDVPSRQ